METSVSSFGSTRIPTEFFPRKRSHRREAGDRTNFLRKHGGKTGEELKAEGK